MNEFEQLSDDELKRLLRDEFYRIEGANLLREKLRMWACWIGMAGFVGAVFISGKSFGAVILTIWAGCLALFYCNKPKPYIHVAGDDWRKIGCLFLLEAKNERAKVYFFRGRTSDYDS